MSILREQGLYMRGLTHSIKVRGLRFETKFASKELQQAILKAISKMTRVVSGSVELDDTTLKCSIFCGKIPDWRIAEELEAAETAVLATATAVAKQYRQQKVKQHSEATSPPVLTLVGGSQLKSQRYNNNPRPSLRRRR